MAILIDYSQVAISSLMAHVNNKQFNGEIDTDLVRHMILNALRHFRSNHKDKYGELVICCDDKNYWRRDYFPYYKAQRKESRYNDGYDWKSIFENLELIKTELDEINTTGTGTTISTGSSEAYATPRAFGDNKRKKKTRLYGI